MEKLINLPIVRACTHKWMNGREEHGQIFEGDPIEELFEELIDAINYADEAEIQGHEVRDIREALMKLAEQVQELRLEALGGEIVAADRSAQ